MSDQRHPISHGSRGAHGSHDAPGHGGTGPGWWRRFKRSPFLPASVLTLIIAAAAGLFAGSYTYAMADPTPHRIPVAAVGAPADRERAAAFADAVSEDLRSSLDLHEYPTYAGARDALESQEVFAVLRVPADIDRNPLMLDVSGASGASVAELLTQAARTVDERTGLRVEVRDVKPLGPGDPRGLALFYVSLAAVVTGFIGAIQMSIHAKALDPAERIAFTAAYSLLGGFAITAVVGWLLDAVRFPFVHSWMILALTMFTSGMVFTMFQALMGRWAMLPTWGLMVLLGNPSSGGAVSWPLLPSPLGTIGRWLPPGASVNAQHTAVYFPGHQHVQPYLVLAGWAVVSCAVFWVWRHRHPGGRTAGP
ncbi:MAG TPA: ABC transporter permease [Streptomyces sp.]|uniref:ABC transporter permease n=1 Tax=Streptomyces sp. TaxID=1931 RepID=UPI002D67AF91|nr:ABC transporter permease [Streptomyces sp.]HZG04024.1 ABC transporter permease [Streptomyces sp.]